LRLFFPIAHCLEWNFPREPSRRVVSGVIGLLYVKDYNLAFRHIPKNAGKAIRRSLENAATISHASIARDLRIDEAEAERLLVGNVVLPGYGLVQMEHLPLEAMRSHFPHSFDVLRNARSFVLAREPRARFFSALLQRLGEYKNVKGLRRRSSGDERSAARL